MKKPPSIESDSAKILSLADETQFAPNGIVSRTLVHTAGSRTVLFGFSEGQELTEHTSTQHALIHFDAAMEAAVILQPREPFTRQTVKLLSPKEHGSWSLALEPLALGLLVAPSPAGGALATAALAGFFLRRPLKLLLFGKSDPRRSLASGWAIILAATALAGLFLAAKLAGMEKLWPLIPAALAAGAFAWFDSRNEARAEAAELAGTIAFGILPAAFGALAGWSIVESLALAAVMLTRSVPTVLFVRTYMRLRKGRTATRLPAFIATTLGFILLAWLVIFHIAPWLALVFGFLLAARAFWLLGENRPHFAPKIVGTMEMILGVAMVLTLAIVWKPF